jgi:DNA adenine methylase
MKNDRTLFYEYRDRFNDMLADGRGTTVEAASLFYYLNRTGYNGLCRFNQQGEFNVPFGRYKQIGYRSDFTDYRDVLSAWEITNDDVEALELRRDDFVYADPPYDVEFTQYAQGGFSWEDQKRTAVFLAKHPGPVILVNQATRRIKELYRDLGFKTKTLDAPRRISCNGDRTPAREILATKNL